MLIMVALPHSEVIRSLKRHSIWRRLNSWVSLLAGSSACGYLLRINTDLLSSHNILAKLFDTAVCFLIFYFSFLIFLKPVDRIRNSSFYHKIGEAKSGQNGKLCPLSLFPWTSSFPCIKFRCLWSSDVFCFFCSSALYLYISGCEFLQLATCQSTDLITSWMLIKASMAPRRLPVPSCMVNQKRKNILQVLGQMKGRAVFWERGTWITPAKDCLHSL